MSKTSNRPAVVIRDGQVVKQEESWDKAVEYKDRLITQDIKRKSYGHKYRVEETDNEIAGNNREDTFAGNNR